VYDGYFTALGTISFYGLIFANAASVAVSLASSMWLGTWANSSEDGNGSVAFYIGIYVVLSIATVIMNLVGNLVGYSGAVDASRSMHADLVRSLMMAPISFFDSTPIGRITNRLSKDINQIDTSIMLNVQLIVRLGRPQH
jgi:ATP-binding cassette, subfamily C (CFTR/MRP), member 1